MAKSEKIEGEAPVAEAPAAAPPVQQNFQVDVDVADDAMRTGHTLYTVDWKIREIIGNVLPCCSAICCSENFIACT